MFFRIFTASNNDVMKNIIYSFFYEEDLKNFKHSCYSFITTVENICLTLWNKAMISLIQQITYG